MSWVRHGDESDTDPRLMAVMGLPGADNRSPNEVHGFISRCAAYSAKHKTDYVIDLGAAVLYANGNHEQLIALSVGAGLMEWADIEGVRKLRIVEDPDYIHIRSKADTEWDNQRSRDNTDPNLKGPVILRDGDQCRWCGKEVVWPGKVSNRKATLDHLHPGEPGTVDTLVVACLTCNTSRQDDDTGSWDQYHQLRPVPEHPHYGRWTLKYLQERGLLPTPSDAGASEGSSQTSEAASVAALPGLGCDPGTASSPVSRGASEGIPAEVDPGTPDQGASEGPAAGDPGTVDRDGQDPDRASRALGTAQSPGRVGKGTGRTGKGRDVSGRGGTGQVGTGGGGQGRAGSGRQASGGSGKRRRRKR